MKKSSGLNGKMTEEVGNQKRKGQMQMWTGYKSWCVED
jgi:hypothetical protein